METGSLSNTANAACVLLRSDASLHHVIIADAVQQWRNRMTANLLNDRLTLLIKLPFLSRIWFLNIEFCRVT